MLGSADLKTPAVVSRAYGLHPRGFGLVIRIGTGALVAVAFGVLALLLYETGGMPNPYVHLAYLPIVFAGSVFGLAGGAVAGLVAGVGVAGPLMPADTATGEMQSLSSWVVRAGAFVLIGSAAGFLMGRLRDQLDKIQSASFRHPVSRLPTQAALEVIIGEMLESLKKRDDQYGLIMVDVRNFNQIFNTLGSDVMPHVPGAIVDRLRTLFGLHWQLFHIHAGKLAVLVPEHRETASEQARSALSRLNDPVEINGVPVYVDVVAGAASFDETDTHASAILQRANTALDDANRRGAEFMHYAQVRSADSKDTIALLAGVPDAIRKSEFRLYYQPQIRLADGQVTGCEALLRWQHPVRGLLSPGAFIPLLEGTALIRQLTLWVARAGLQQAADWQRAGLDLTIALNISPRNIEDQQLFAMILQEIRQQGVAPHRIELEITESAIIDDASAVARNLAELKNAGVSVALDDFGAGFTSVRHLTTLPIDKLKIDRSLIDGVTHNNDRMRVVAGITGLAHDLGLDTLAEGVEDLETENYLREEGCRAAQGFYYSKPVPAAQFFQGLQGSSWTLR